MTDKTKDYLINEYLKSISHNHKSQKGFDNKRYILSNFMHFINVKLEKVNIDVLAEYENKLKTKKLTHKTIIYSFNVVKGFFDYIAEKKIISENPVILFKKQFSYDDYSPEFKHYYRKYFLSKNAKDKRAIARVLNVFFEYLQAKGKNKFEQITKEDLIDFKRKLKGITRNINKKLKQTSVIVYLQTLNRWFNYLKKQDLNYPVLDQAGRIFLKGRITSAIKITENQANLISEYITESGCPKMRQANIRYYLKLFFEYLNENDLRLNKIKPLDVYNYQSYLMSQEKAGKIRFSTGSVKKSILHAKKMYKYLKKKNIVYSNPFYAVRLVKTAKALPRNILKEDKMNILLKALSNFIAGKNLNEQKALYKAHVAAEVLYSTGARIGEASRMKVSDVDLAGGVVKIIDTKANCERYGILNEYVKEVLRIYIENVRATLKHKNNHKNDELLFYSGAGFESRFNKTVNNVSQKLGLGEFKSHNMRHAVGFHLLRAGCDIRYIQEILGHKRLSTTQIYTKVDKEDLRGVLDKYHPRSIKEKT